MFQGMDGVLALTESFVAASELEYMRPIVLSLFGMSWTVCSVGR